MRERSFISAHTYGRPRRVPAGASFDNWTGPERISTDAVRFYVKLNGTLVPDVNGEGIRTIEGYHSITAGKTTADRNQSPLRGGLR